MKTMKKMLAALLVVVMLFGAVCIPAAAEDEIPLIEEGQWYVRLGAGEAAVCAFVPDSTTQYCIHKYVSGTPATQYAVLDENGNTLAHEKNEIIITLEAGKVYYILIGFWSETASGRIDFQIYDHSRKVEADRTYTTECYTMDCDSWNRFAPTRTNYYTLCTTRADDARVPIYVTLYESNGKVITTAQYDENAGGVRLSALLREGKTYYYLIQFDPTADPCVCDFQIVSERYPDVSPNAWYYDAVSYVSDKGYMSGYGNGYFGPADNLQRQDFVVTLARVAGADLSAYATADGGLSDVKAGSYYAPAVAWAVENGIITGYQSGKFGVGDKITREQVCTILYRFKNSPAVENTAETLAAFPDSARVSDYATDAMAWAVQNGVISGSNGKLVPTSGASRAQIATILMRMDQNGLL